MRFTIVLAALAALALCSCTDEQIGRAQKIVDETDLRLAQATAAEQKAEQALAVAKDLADKLGSEQGQRIVAQAGAALEQVKQVQAIAATTDQATHAALDAAIGAQKAGGSSIAVVGAAATGMLPGILAALVAGMKWLSVLRSYRQTVTGLDNAKEALGADWGTKVAPALDAAHDESTRKLVAGIQAKSA